MKNQVRLSLGTQQTSLERSLRHLDQSCKIHSAKNIRSSSYIRKHTSIMSERVLQTKV